MGRRVWYQDTQHLVMSRRTWYQYIALGTTWYKGRQNIVMVRRVWYQDTLHIVMVAGYGTRACSIL